MEKKEKEENQEFKEEFIEEIPKIKPDTKKFISKIILGKKTILKRKMVPPPVIIDPPRIEKKTNADILVESIVKTYWISKWKSQLQIMKYSKQGFNKKRGDFRHFCMKMNNAMRYHQYLYLAKLFDKMEKMPKKDNIQHNNNFGKLIFMKNNNNNNINIGDINNIMIKTENKIQNNDINDKDIKINLPDIEEIEYKPDNINKQNNEKNKEEKMNIEKNNNDIKDEKNDTNEINKKNKIND